MMILVKISL